MLCVCVYVCLWPSGRVQTDHRKMTGNTLHFQFPLSWHTDAHRLSRTHTQQNLLQISYSAVRWNPHRSDLFCFFLFFFLQFREDKSQHWPSWENWSLQNACKAPTYRTDWRAVLYSAARCIIITIFIQFCSSVRCTVDKTRTPRVLDFKEWQKDAVRLAVQPPIPLFLMSLR